jgi:hypothetical protein
LQNGTANTGDVNSVLQTVQIDASWNRRPAWDACITAGFACAYQCPVDDASDQAVAQSDAMLSQLGADDLSKEGVKTINEVNKAADTAGNNRSGLAEMGGAVSKLEGSRASPGFASCERRQKSYRQSIQLGFRQLRNRPCF